VALLAPLVALDLPLTAIRFIEPILLGGAVLLFHRGLRRRLERGPALAWTYVLGLYVPFLSVVPPGPQGAAVDPPGGRGHARAGAGPARRAVAVDRWRPGLSLAALTMVRLEYGWVALALLAAAALTWAVRRRSPHARRGLAVAAVAVAGCLPWLAYTQHLTGQPLYWGTSSGLSLYWISPTLRGRRASGTRRAPSSAIPPSPRPARSSAGSSACIPWRATASCGPGRWRTSARARPTSRATSRPT
jgi:hypothetical protein